MYDVTVYFVQNIEHNRSEKRTARKKKGENKCKIDWSLITAVVINNPLLEHIYLAGNRLLSEGMNVVTETCKKHSKNLKSLDIWCNPATMDNILLKISYIHSLTIEGFI